MGKKFYAVKQGRVPGVYNSWEECKKQVHGFSGPVYKSFPTAAEAMAFVTGQTSGTEGTKAVAKHTEADRTSVLPEGDENAVVAYVDGSYHSGTGEFSYGAVILWQGKEICLKEKMTDPELASMRNVAGEIKGAECAMRYAVEHGIRALTIVHDYAGIACWCLGQWKANKEGTKAYKAYYDSIKDQVQITFQKVKGHSGDHYNDMADRLAKEALGIQ